MGVLCVYIIQIVNEMHQKSRHLNGKCKNCRERERDRERQRETERERQRDRERQRETERDREDLMTNNMLDMLITKFLYTCIYIGFCAI